MEDDDDEPQDASLSFPRMQTGSDDDDDDGDENFEDGSEHYVEEEIVS